MLRIGTLSLAVVFLCGMLGLASPDAQGGKEGKKESTPELLTKVNPKYPEEAKKEKIQGEVILETVIAQDGSVREAKAVKSPDERLSKAAIEAVMQWKYKPTVNSKGKPVAVKATVTIRFRLQ